MMKTGYTPSSVCETHHVSVLQLTAACTWTMIVAQTLVSCRSRSLLQSLHCLQVTEPQLNHMTLHLFLVKEQRGSVQQPCLLETVITF